MCPKISPFKIIFYIEMKSEIKHFAQLTTSTVYLIT